MEEKTCDITLAARLRRLLNLHGRSIREFSTTTGIPYRTLQDYLSGKAKPGADQLARMATFGIDMNFLLTGKSRFWESLHIPGNVLPSDDTARYILADAEVVSAIDYKARAMVTDHIGKNRDRPDIMDFDLLYKMYLSFFVQLAEVFSKANPPIAEARKVGMPTGQLVASILDMAAQMLASRAVALGSGRL